MTTRERCPECGSDELRETTRRQGAYGEIKAMVCGVCDWSSDPRLGRPPADRSKNVTLRRLLRKEEPAEESGPDG